MYLYINLFQILVKQIPFFACQLRWSYLKTDSLDAPGINYEYQIFEGGHFDKLHERFTIAVSFLCEKMHHSHPMCDGSWEFSDVPQAERTFGYHSTAYDRASFETRITFDLQISGFVSLDIYDGMGRVVETLVNSHLDPGMHNVEFYGSSLAPGVYFYNIRSGDTSVTGKVLLLI
ncbi:MAG: T9SS type A sorting domain-containing protein [Candidatus Sabulitectum sp.]|nr:T9SS type A sorting domain-containing protein [Candidatus Sabulitectum sp.]